mmetsp:Transcript_13871/g.23672  ORF Transcript_13871/g.23672 Transcript_13871/m.23672 type:complete len:106 (+) Transcript_13871:112-429(+)
MLRWRAKKDKAEASITVMTRNMYVGFSTRLHSKQGPLVALTQLDAIDFEARAVAMAAEICTSQPDLIASQEASTLTIGSPSGEILESSLVFGRHCLCFQLLSGSY